ncbi:superoxide dismutase family protein [Streptomyces sp. SID8379]|uniref:superoxide dismutase family protein n=1 Tax=unclassified Streptomyces TaxID=2593676 RepID=UPI0003641AC3|nr:MULTISPECIES: superoxide dismutase family protein [unclassified Streptomyces]MYW65428.1 superoxide dismutase family protein [Streptomyces sp. SID8379]
MVAGMVTGALAAAVLAAGGGSASAADCYWLRVEGRFAPPTAFVPSSAVTYDMGLVPAAASVRVEQRGDEAGMTVTLEVAGLVPGRAYGAHVHEKPCGADPEAAGGHYRHVRDPERADAGNEVWLDFTADASGDGRAAVRKAWGLRAGGAGSVVLHDVPGGAGARIACFTVPFAGAA